MDPKRPDLTPKQHELLEKRKALHGKRRKLHERLSEVCEEFVLGDLTRGAQAKGPDWRIAVSPGVLPRGIGLGRRALRGQRMPDAA